MDATLIVGKQGRVVIPAEVRAALDLEPGDSLHLHLDDRRIILERPVDAGRVLRGLTANIVKGRSLVDELLADRRREAAAQ